VEYNCEDLLFLSTRKDRYGIMIFSITIIECGVSPICTYVMSKNT
jgi:hypothetical protein